MPWTLGSQNTRVPRGQVTCLMVTALKRWSQNLNLYPVASRTCGVSPAPTTCSLSRLFSSFPHQIPIKRDPRGPVRQSHCLLIPLGTSSSPPLHLLYPAVSMVSRLPALGTDINVAPSPPPPPPHRFLPYHLLCVNSWYQGPTDQSQGWLGLSELSWH